MIMVAELKSTRAAKAHSNPVVAKSRRLVIRSLQMVITLIPGSVVAMAACPVGPSELLWRRALQRTRGAPNLRDLSDRAATMV